MLIDITPDTLPRIKNPALAAYATMYLDIYADFMQQVRGLGISIAAQDDSDEVAAKRKALKERGAIFRNADKSIYINSISPACIVCRDSVGSETFFVSLKCHRDCYFCFNPNQENYDYYQHHKRDIIRELDQIYENHRRLTHLAVTGGEPLLHKSDVITFFEHAGHQHPNIHKRLYTCGDHTDDETLAALQAAGLEEIRFSIRMYDLEAGHRHTLDRIRRAVDFIPSVMVEMPVQPDKLPELCDLLCELDAIGISSINLLEFCYPLVDPEPFNERGYAIKPRPYKVLYNYWYASGLPIAGSELASLDLLDFALDQGLRMGVHYCSLENKFTAQLYNQNFNQPVPGYLRFSEQDFFYKSAKAFGDDVQPVLQRLKRKGCEDYVLHTEQDILEFHVDCIPLLAELDIELGISTQVVETRGSERYLRELKVDLTYPQQYRRDQTASE
jgi:uncharacterized protein